MSMSFVAIRLFLSARYHRLSRTLFRLSPGKMRRVNSMAHSTSNRAPVYRQEIIYSIQTQFILVIPPTSHSVHSFYFPASFAVRDLSSALCFRFSSIYINIFQSSISITKPKSSRSMLSRAIRLCLNAPYPVLWQTSYELRLGLPAMARSICRRMTSVDSQLALWFLTISSCSPNTIPPLHNAIISPIA